MPVDDFDLEVTGVRVSLTDRCNFGCGYCHNEGFGNTRGSMEPADGEMSTDDIVRFFEVAQEFDIDVEKFTDREPMCVRIWLISFGKPWTRWRYL